ncbi:transglutaminase domain-containing protein [candidate division CSSED10-310 bacterium]|uniref:Transglutaminase domain-containing protein n=1 Tax=candidate division CSSED10-310 bacterium TaxID=2855610 RepID=A0ABV6YVL7_UNCC1
MKKNCPWRMPRLILKGAFFGVLFYSYICSASLIYLEGKHVVSFQFPNFHDAEMPDFIDYSNNGFSQQVKKDEIWQAVKLESSLSQLKTKAPFPVNERSLPDKFLVFLKPSKLIQSDHSEINHLRRRLVDEYKPKTVVDFVRACITYAKENVAYDLTVPQNALSALELRKGSCVGISCLVIALLRNAGIPARYVLGYNPPGYNWGQKEEVFGVTQTGGGFHMWMEAYYPDCGWVFSDPANSINHVDIYHWVIEVGKDETINPRFLKRIGDAMRAARTSIEHLSETKDIRVVGIFKGLPAKSNLFSRISPSDQVEYVGSLHVRILSAQKREIIPHGQLHYYTDRRKYYIHEADKSGIISLPVLTPGEHVILCQAEGYATTPKMKVLIERGKTNQQDVYLEAGGEITCWVVDEDNNAISRGEIVLWTGLTGKAFPINKDGTYTFTGLKAGKYYVSVQKKGYREKRHAVKLLAGKKKRLKIMMQKTN